MKIVFYVLGIGDKLGGEKNRYKVFMYFCRRRFYFMVICKWVIFIRNFEWSRKIRLYLRMLEVGRLVGGYCSKNWGVRWLIFWDLFVIFLGWIWWVRGIFFNYEDFFRGKCWINIVFLFFIFMFIIILFKRLDC